MASPNDLMSEFQKLKMETNKINENFVDTTSTFGSSSELILLRKVLDELKSIKLGMMHGTPDTQRALRTQKMMEMMKHMKALGEIEEKINKVRMELYEKINKSPETAEQEIEKVMKALNGLLKPSEPVFEDLDSEPEKKEPKNWNDLPAELKLHCIDRMSFMSKIRLGTTSRTERKLVKKAKKIQWDSVTLKFTKEPYNSNKMIFVAKAHKLTIRKSAIYRYGGSIEPLEVQRQLNNLTDALIYVFKKGEVNTFGISEFELDTPPTQMPYKLKEHAPFKFREFWMDETRTPWISQFFLGHCDGVLERVRIIGSIFKCHGPLDLSPPGFLEFSEIWSTFNCKYLQFDVRILEHKMYAAILQQMMEKWIENDVPIGTKMLYWRTFEPSEKVLSVVRTQVFQFKPNSHFMIRIMDEEAPKPLKREEILKKKTILLREQLVEPGFAYVSCEVIPTELRPSEYEDAKEWFWKVPEI